MVTKLKVLLFFILAVNCADAISDSATRYPVSEIPATLLENSEVVYRSIDQRVVVNSSASLTLSRIVAVTILRESGVNASVLSIGYDKMIRVTSISGTIYDAAGDRVRTIKSSEILDYSAYDGFSLYSDNRMKYIDPKYFSYPFTIEYEVELNLKSVLFLPDFYVFKGYNSAVERAKYQITAPSDFKINIRESGGMPACVQTKKDNNTIYSWQYDNFIARRQEPYSTAPSHQYPFVMVSPYKFQYDSYSGGTDSWGTFGRFIKSLNDGKQVLPESTVSEIRNLIKDSPSTRASIERIYRFSQKKNRYVSIQEGIGGMQPFEAETVDRLSYGDCKALSNYVMALLSAAGIESHYSLIQAGSVIEPVYADFVMDYFNHVVLCVPNNGDTVWLECTNPHLPAGYIGSFTDDRYALMITPDGGKLVRTPSYTHTNNVTSSRSNYHISPDGKATLNMEVRSRGTYYWQEFQILLLDARDREKELLRSVALQDISVPKYEFIVDTLNPGNITRKMDVQINNCASFMGDMMILTPDPVNRPMSVPPVARKRESPVNIQRSSTKIDSIFVHIPKGYKVSGVPENLQIENEFAAFSMEVIKNETFLLIVKRLQYNKGVYSPDKYITLRDFCEKVSSRENEKLMFKKAL